MFPLIVQCDKKGLTLTHIPSLSLVLDPNVCTTEYSLNLKPQKNEKFKFNYLWIQFYNFIN